MGKKDPWARIPADGPRVDPFVLRSQRIALGLSHAATVAACGWKPCGIVWLSEVECYRRVPGAVRLGKLLAVLGLRLDEVRSECAAWTTHRRMFHDWQRRGRPPSQQFTLPPIARVA